MDQLGSGWLWIIAGLLIALAELVLPGWFLLGIGLSTLAMGVLILVGVWTGSLPAALVITALMSGVAWLLLSRFARGSRGTQRVWHRDINDD